MFLNLDYYKPKTKKFVQKNVFYAVTLEQISTFIWQLYLDMRYKF